MPTSDVNLAERSGSLVEAYKSYDPRVVFFYFALAVLFSVLVAGLAYQQLIKTDRYSDAERQQNQRRVLVPGPRGNIYDREGRVLVGNRPRFSVVLYIDELRAELRREQIRIRKNYRELDDKDLPSAPELERIARISVVGKYLDRVNAILGSEYKVDPGGIARHFQSKLLVPYTLVDELDAKAYAKLIERLPVNSPLQVYSSSSRYYPYDAAASHTLGSVKIDDNIDAEDMPGDDLRTFRLTGERGRDGLEEQFDSMLEGTAGASIFRVDPAGFRINPPLVEKRPKQGKDLTTSLDIDLQLAAEEALGDQWGAVVAIDVATGEVLVLASKPNYDLNQYSPHATREFINQMNETRAWTNNAIAAALPPGSTFKILTSIAAMRRGGVTPDEPIVDCEAWYKVGTRDYPCYNGRGRHGEILLSDAIAQSCDIYFYKAGELATPDGLAAEARRFHLDRPTGIELPNETSRMLIPDPVWKSRVRDEAWFPGDTANMAIGQGDVLVTPLQMACFAASVARGETLTIPTLLHEANRPPQHSDPIGLTQSQREAILTGMQGCTEYGTAKRLSDTPAYAVPGIPIAGKTGTAQKDVVTDGVRGKINYAWFVCFAPLEAPEIAVAVVIQGDTGEEFAGGMYAAPVASAVLQHFFGKKPAR